MARWESMLELPEGWVPPFLPECHIASPGLARAAILMAELPELTRVPPCLTKSECSNQTRRINAKRVNTHRLGSPRTLPQVGTPKIRAIPVLTGRDAAGVRRALTKIQNLRLGKGTNNNFSWDPSSRKEGTQRGAGAEMNNSDQNVTVERRDKYRSVRASC